MFACNLLPSADQKVNWMFDMNPNTNRAQDFLDLLERAKRGRLKIYLGFAAGVGKTVRMLKEAQALKLRGVDVVLGFIEPHGRAETAESDRRS